MENCKNVSIKLLRLDVYVKLAYLHENLKDGNLKMRGILWKMFRCISNIFGS